MKYKKYIFINITYTEMVLLAIPSVIPYFTVIPDVRQAHTVDFIYPRAGNSLIAFLSKLIVFCKKMSE